MISPTILLFVHWIAGFVVLAAGLHRLEHLNLFGKGLSRKDRAFICLEAVAWAALCVGAAGAIVTPLMPLERPTLQDSCVMGGLAGLLLILRRKGVKCLR